MKKLSLLDIILLGMTNFALYVGAGNIIFPPILGLQAGDNVGLATIGFLLTGVGLPVIAAIALARVRGNLNAITAPIGLKAGLAASVICYLCIGPLYAIPRTATVSFELTVSPFMQGDYLLPVYSAIYFVIAVLFALYPSKILDTVGKILSPLKIAALLFLVATGIFLIPGEGSAAQGVFVDGAFAQGIINGYLTLDTLASLAFGIVIVDAIRSRNVTDNRSTVRYATISGCIAGVGFITIYLGLFHIGYSSYIIAPQADNGAQVLGAYVNFAFGSLGNIFLALLIGLACLVTAIGLICACSSYFSKITGIKYRTFALIFALSSGLIANLGLTELIRISVPILIAIYPMFIVLVFASFLTSFIKRPAFVIAPTALAALLFGLNDAAESLNLHLLPDLLRHSLPLYSSSLSWLLPCLVLFMILWLTDHLRHTEQQVK